MKGEGCLYKKVGVGGVKIGHTESGSTYLTPVLTLILLTTR